MLCEEGQVLTSSLSFNKKKIVETKTSNFQVIYGITVVVWDNSTDSASGFA